MSKRNYNVARNDAIAEQQFNVFKEVTAPIRARLDTLEAEVVALKEETARQQLKNRELINTIEAINAKDAKIQSTLANYTAKVSALTQRINAAQSIFKNLDESTSSRLKTVFEHLVNLENRMR